MHAVDQNEETSCEIFFKYFRENKVEIADAITKPFPFLESLRDRSFITDKIYTDSREACRNMVPVERVVYNVLCHLEESLDWSLMQTLFSRVHLKEYPGLTEIHRSFENVLQEKYFSQKTNRKEKQKTFNTQQSCEKGN
ncbi:PREDICTED: nuclear body protein SP140-like protein isoform X2 [Chinchilla lanigera]|nr:PREDICTED: nuclear body protein SP140-like protein isoform X2 [Chinchilla lanigera]XP_005395475.1 PREDICTED: nuclear body protein SP140-like protein isoform X2 [Chinchilla lanigera]XP_013375267.1 PREDICTED: nuclear body protein SP140-like protein isoform X2 [Chinchilla lanigera]